MGKVFNTFKGVMVRIFFGLHIVACVYQLVDVKNKQWGWWFIAIGACILLFVEASITLCCSKHGEWRRFVPCIFIYLLGTVPALAITEWTSLETRLEYQNEYKNATGIWICPKYAEANATLVVPGVAKLTYEFSIALHQALAILLVAGRWILPKGKMSREKLSNMLLAFIGMAADILEFYSEGIQIDEIRCIKEITLAILIIWSVSLFQFSFEITHSMRTRTRSQTDAKKDESILQRCQNSEVWAIVCIILLQDGPFLAMRLYLIIEHGVLEQGLIFFTFKNILVVLLQLYRLWILLCITWDHTEGKLSNRFVVSVRNHGSVRSRRNRSESQNPISMGEDNEAFDSDDMTNNNRPPPFSVSSHPPQHHDQNSQFQMSISRSSLPYDESPRSQPQIDPTRPQYNMSSRSSLPFDESPRSPPMDTTRPQYNMSPRPPPDANRSHPGMSPRSSLPFDESPHSPPVDTTRPQYNMSPRSPPDANRSHPSMSPRSSQDISRFQYPDTSQRYPPDTSRLPYDMSARSPLDTTRSRPGMSPRSQQDARYQQDMSRRPVSPRSQNYFGRR